MSTPVIEVENRGIIEIRDPEIDVAEIMRRIRQNMAIREKLPPLPAALGQARLLEERKNLRTTIQDLHARVLNYGAVETLHTGWRGHAELFVKKCIRKVLRRYLAQQQEVHERLMDAIYQLAGYLDQQDEVLRLRFDQCNRQIADKSSEPNASARVCAGASGSLRTKAS
jgi:CheY-like chemotaxis protein